MGNKEVGISSLRYHFPVIIFMFLGADASKSFFVLIRAGIAMNGRCRKSRKLPRSKLAFETGPPIKARDDLCAAALPVFLLANFTYHSKVPV
jgi:hypothetical protein